MDEMFPGLATTVGRVVGGWTHADLARLLGLPVGVVGRNEQRVRSRARRIVTANIVLSRLADTATDASLQQGSPSQSMLDGAPKAEPVPPEGAKAVYAGAIGLATGPALADLFVRVPAALKSPAAQFILRTAAQSGTVPDVGRAQQTQDDAGGLGRRLAETPAVSTPSPDAVPRTAVDSEPSEPGAIGIDQPPPALSRSDEGPVHPDDPSPTLMPEAGSASSGWGAVTLRDGELIPTASRMPPIPPAQRSPFPRPGARPKWVSVNPNLPYPGPGRPAAEGGMSEPPNPLELLDNIYELNGKIARFGQSSLQLRWRKLFEFGYFPNRELIALPDADGAMVNFDMYVFNDPEKTSFARIDLHNGDNPEDFNVVFQYNSRQYTLGGRWYEWSKNPLNFSRW